MGNYIEGGYWSPVGSAAFSGAGGGGGSYVDTSRVYDSNITIGSNIGKPGMTCEWRGNRCCMP